MDPNTALNDCRDAIADGDDDALVAAFEALDDWLCGGGFLPAGWSSARPTPAAGLEVLHRAAGVFDENGYETLGEQVRYAADSLEAAEAVTR